MVERELITQRTTAATPQIQSLNPLVSLTALPTLSPFVRDPTNEENGAKVDRGREIEEFLKKEKVDVVVGCDLSRGDIVRFILLFPILPFHLHASIYTSVSHRSSMISLLSRQPR